ncbi:MAG: hypothetical protein EXX96DRAFT_617135 [Benjaminiella poitrasii]|nr:MAG: hypothetical protein EXX96DRAFT_617135 [Benjaminiella poitrasii]
MYVAFKFELIWLSEHKLNCIESVLEAGLSIKKAAKQLGMSPSTISKYAYELYSERANCPTGILSVLFYFYFVDPLHGRESFALSDQKCLTFIWIEDVQVTAL